TSHTTYVTTRDDGPPCRATPLREHTSHTARARHTRTEPRQPANRPERDTAGRILPLPARDAILVVMSSETSSGGARSRGARQQRITDYVIENGSASAAELVELTGVSHMTVHRDLDELARRGLLRKFRGGVSAQPSTVFESNAEYRLGAHVDEKAAIAQQAL